MDTPYDATSENILDPEVSARGFHGMGVIVENIISEEMDSFNESIFEVQLNCVLPNDNSITWMTEQQIKKHGPANILRKWGDKQKRIISNRNTSSLAIPVSIWSPENIFQTKTLEFVHLIEEKTRKAEFLTRTETLNWDQEASRLEAYLYRTATQNTENESPRALRVRR